MGWLMGCRGGIYVRFGSEADISRRMSASPSKVQSSSGSCHSADKAKVRLCNLVHCCRAAIGAMTSERYCQSMLDRPSDEDVSRQILRSEERRVGKDGRSG